MNNNEDVAKHYKKKQIQSATPGQLIVLLYDGAIDYLNRAESAIDDKNPKSIEKYHNNLIRAQDIITELMASLNMEEGGDIAKNLQRLYDFMNHRLIDANMSKDHKPIEEVRGLLVELRDAWASIASKEGLPKHDTETTSTNLNIKG